MWFWTSRGFAQEGHRWLRAALDRVASIPEPHGEESRKMQIARAKGLMGATNISYGEGDYQAGLEE